ncbi:uncharacterized protein LOC142173579 [Nicotiana tabacum]|uniref:Uncharacterized protein LOC142173579 n=1 Tax=Nicotiana tabacum TaxID=4097 RepID=A0AC58TDM6_TOBAC
MKQEYCMLSLLVSGPRSPGNDIDIYLQPLIEALKVLWESGVDTYDALRNQTFQMRAALMWIISDFSAYAKLSRWSTKGKLACPCCNYGTNSCYLKHSQKICYMDHHVFLPMDHPWRSNKRSFNEKTEFRPPPELLKGTDVFNMLQNVENVFGKMQKKSNSGPWKKKGCPLGGKNGDPNDLDDKSLSQAHRYILNNCDEIEEYVREHELEVNSHERRSKWSMAKSHSQNFFQWFESRIMHTDVPDFIKQLSRGPNSIAKRYSGYLINGYRFHKRQHDARRTTQNSGVTLVALTTSFASSKDKNPVDANLTYYGRIIDIIELDYFGHFKVVLFKCDWYEAEEDTYGLTYVYFNKKCYQEEPFLLASQAHQYFYVQDPHDQDKHYVMNTVPRDLFNISDQFKSDAPYCYENGSYEHPMSPSIPNDEGEVVLIRSDVPATIIYVPPERFCAQEVEIESEDEFDVEDTS